MTSIGSNQYQNLPLKEGIKAEDFKAKVDKALADAPEGKGVITKEEFEELSKDLKTKESVTELITDLTKDGATFTDPAKESAKTYAGDSVAPKITALFEKAATEKRLKENPLADKLADPKSNLSKRLERLGIPKEEVENFIKTGEASPKIQEMFNEAGRKLPVSELWGPPFQKSCDSSATTIELLDAVKGKLDTEKKSLVAQRDKLKGDPAKEKEVSELNGKISKLDDAIKTISDSRLQALTVSLGNQKSWTNLVTSDMKKEYAQADELYKQAATEKDPAKRAELEKKADGSREKGNKRAKVLGTPMVDKPKPPEPKTEPKPKTVVPKEHPVVKVEIPNEPTGATEVDNNEVAKIILDAEEVGKAQYPDDEAKAAKASLDWVMQKRNSGKPSDATDVNWAAADHYLYAKKARKEYGPKGGGVVTILALGYDVVKAGLSVIKKEKLLSGGKPISKPTIESTEWGVKGGLGVNVGKQDPVTLKDLL